MIFTEIYYGQGLGNQLAVYVTARSLAADLGVPFAMKGKEFLGDPRYNKSGLYFMDMDLGIEYDESKIQHHYREKELRLITNNSHHDATLGCDIRLFDEDVMKIKDWTKIEGSLQCEDYFYHRKEEIKQWLKVKPEHDCKDFVSDDICVLNFRDYRGSSELHLTRKYWADAIYQMLKINPNMQFLVITENPQAAIEMLPELADNTYHFDVGKDYSIIKNARWLILSNSSFAYFPALVNEEAKMIIAPKYWARHNVSDGYWCCGTNLSRDFVYMDRSGVLQSYDECKREFDIYIEQHQDIYKTYKK
jgi:hypothetical protein